MPKIAVSVHGLDELKKALIELGSDVAGKNGGFVRTALMAASKPVLQDAIARVHVDSGTLKKQIKRGRIRNPRAYNELVTIGVPKPQWASGQHGVLLNDSYGMFEELGTVQRPAHPFLRPALESNRTESTNIFRVTLARKIELAAKKIGNKNAAAVASKVRSESSFIGPARK